MLPILLVHGMADKDYLFLRSFTRIKKELTALGYTVYISKQDAMGTIEDNAKVLSSEIINIVEKECSPKIHIIAHSKGGLDARYAISKLEMDEHVMSLTTLSTPHHGSILAKKLLKMPKIFAKILNWYWNTIYSILGDIKPNLYKLATQLTPEYLETFNKEVLNKSNVLYQSYAAKPPKKLRSILMLIPSLLLRLFGHTETDGVVEIESAKWGEYKGIIPAWHHNLSGLFINGHKQKAILKTYLEIINNLHEYEKAAH